MFWQKKEKQDENVTLNERFNLIESDIAKAMRLIGELQLENADLRNKVLRKIQQPRKKNIEEEEEDSAPQSEPMPGQYMG